MRISRAPHQLQCRLLVTYVAAAAEIRTISRAALQTKHAQIQLHRNVHFNHSSPIITQTNAASKQTRSVYFVNFPTFKRSRTLLLTASVRVHVSVSQHPEDRMPRGGGRGKRAYAAETTRYEYKPDVFFSPHPAVQMLTADAYRHNAQVAKTSRTARSLSWVSLHVGKEEKGLLICQRLNTNNTACATRGCLFFLFSV